MTFENSQKNLGESNYALKQKELNRKNLAEIAEEQKDLDRRIADFESTLKSPTTTVDDRGATTREDVAKLYDRKKILTEQAKKLKAIENDKKARETETEIDEDVLKMEKEVARREEEATKRETESEKGQNPESTDVSSRDTDMNEEEKFDKEVARREEEAKKRELKLADDRKKEQDAELKNILDDTRATFTKKNYANNNAMAHIKKILGLQLRDQKNPDMKIVKEDYYNALKAYQESRLANVDSLLPEERADIAKEMFAFNQEEAARLYDGYTQAHAQKIESQPLAKALHGTGQWLTQSKIGKGLLVGLSAAAAATSVRAMLSQAPKFAMKMGMGENVVKGLGKIAAVSMFLAPAGAGIAVGGLVEKWQKVRYENNEKNKQEDFDNMSSEEQMLKLMDFNQDSFDTLLKTMGKRVNRRRISMTAGGMTTLAALMMTGDFAMQNDAHLVESDVVQEAPLDEYSFDVVTGVTGPFTDNMRHTNAFAEFQESYGANGHAQFLEAHSDNPEAENAWQRSVRRAADRYALEARAELAQQGIPEFDAVGEVATPEIEDLPKPEHIVLESDLDSADATVRAAAGEEPIKIVQNVDVQSAAETQVDASQLAGKPEQVGWNGEGSGISIDHNGIGTLEVNKGGSIEGSLIAFLKENKDKLTDGGMGWNDEKFADVDEWAGKRAHGLVREYMKTHPGFDMNLVQPGTSFEIDLTNTADIHMGDVDFEGGVHIVPDAEKVIMNDSVPTAEKTVVSSPEVLETINTKDGVMHAFNIDDATYNYLQQTPAVDYISEIQTLPADNQTSLDKFLIEISQQDGVNLEDKTIGDILKTVQIDILNQEVPDATAMTGNEKITQSAQASMENRQGMVPPDIMEDRFAELSERAYVAEMIKNRDFKIAIAQQIQEFSGADSLQTALQNVATRPVDFYLGDEGTIGIENQKLQDIRVKAVEIFGDEGQPRPGAKTGDYITRIFAKALRAGKLRDIFPSSEFNA